MVCHFQQTVTAAFSTDLAKFIDPSIDYNYELAYVAVYFDMVTVDPVTVTGPDTTYLATGTFTGVLEFLNCRPGATDCFGNDLPYVEMTSGPIVPAQNCGDEGNYACTFALSGTAEGGTPAFVHRAQSTAFLFDFTGQAQLVPEPASLLLLGSGIGIGAIRTCLSKLGNKRG